MAQNIAFIGGIHGVGKSTVCKAICDEAGLKYLSASKVLKWQELNTDSTNKQVADISYTQSRLVTGLRALVDHKNKFLLDGHYCLVNKRGIIEEIPVDTFRQINPYSLNLIIDDISAIKDRLEKRDNKSYDKNLLTEMQDAEVFYAKRLSDILKVRLNICTATDVSLIVNILK